MSATKDELVGNWEGTRRELVLLSNGLFTFKSEIPFLMQMIPFLVLLNESISGNWDLVDDCITLQPKAELLANNNLRIWKIISRDSHKLLIKEDDGSKHVYNRK